MIKQCKRCNEERSAVEFYKNKRRADGLSSYCKVCDDEHNRLTRSKHREKNIQHRRNYRSRLKEKYNLWKQDKCCNVCNEADECCFELHHLDGSEKENHPSVILKVYGWEAFLEESKKCVLLCANCHRKVHAGRIKV